MHTFRSIVEKLESSPVTVRGQTFNVRQLTGIEMEMIGRVWPRPEVPMVDDPDAGSLAPKIPNRSDPEYLAALEAWGAEYAAAVAAVGLGHEQLGTSVAWPTVDVTTHRKAATRQQAEAFIREALPLVLAARWSEVTACYEAATGRAGDAVAEAEKN
jgi:hypothetical protein